MSNTWKTRDTGGRAIAAAALVLLALTAVACGGGEEIPAAAARSATAANGPLSVYVVNYPLMYFAERIGGEHVEVTFPAPAGVDPAYWQPGVDIVAQYQAADLIVRNGAGYAQWTELVSLPGSRVVDTSEAFVDRLIVEENAVTHSHGPEGDHSHGEAAFTTWLDPQQAALQAQAIAAAMAAARPETADDFEANMEALRLDLDALDARLEAGAARLADAPLLASHPVYQYFARRYGLNLQSVHFEPDVFPDAEAWRDLEGLHANHPAAIMLWEAQPLAETAERLRSLGIEIVVFDPVGNRPIDGDYLEVMRKNAANLERPNPPTEKE